MKKVAQIISATLLSIILPHCAPSRYVKPLKKNEQAISFSFGGPVIGYAGAAIPIPFTTLAYANGLNDRLTLFGGLHLTSLAFSNAQIDVGGTYGLWQTAKQGLSTSIALQTASGIGKPNSFRIWPSADLNYYYHPSAKASYAYVGFNSWFELSQVKAHSEPVQRHAVPNLQVGYTLVKNKYQHQFEFKYLGMGIANLPGVVDYKGFGGRGAWAFIIQLVVNFKMKNYLYVILAATLSSCLKLDSNLYNNENTIKSYQLDNYTGEQDFKLDATYDIAPSRVTLMTLGSQTSSESSPTNIKAIYIGDVTKILTDTVLLYCHGNKWHMDFYWQRAKLLAHVNGKNHYGLMMMDYRGFGMSEGKPSEEGMYADVDACMKWLKEKGLTSERLIMYGFSLGTAAATELTAYPRTLRPSRLILEAPFASSEVMVQDASQLNMPASYFTDVKINNADKIKLVKQPFFWLHGLSDNFLNYQTHGEVVYKNYQGDWKQKMMVVGADHGEVPAKAGFQTYLDTLGKFITRH